MKNLRKRISEADALEMFGRTTGDIELIVDEQFFGDAKMAAISVLSDAQHAIEFDPEVARKAINVAKYIVATRTI